MFLPQFDRALWGGYFSVTAAKRCSVPLDEQQDIVLILDLLDLLDKILHILDGFRLTSRMTSLSESRHWLPDFRVQPGSPPSRLFLQAEPLRDFRCEVLHRNP